MRNTVAVLIAASLAAGPASAQLKPTTNSNSNIIITPATQKESTTDAARRIGADEAMKLVRANKAVLVDVRSKAQYDLGHIKGAISIPRSQLIARMREIPPNKMIITYCACPVKEHTGALAVLELNAHGMKNAAALLGGYLAWQQEHRPIE